jgi:hypothetical protein
LGKALIFCACPPSYANRAPYGCESLRKSVYCLWRHFGLSISNDRFASHRATTRPCYRRIGVRGEAFAFAFFFNVALAVMLASAEPIPRSIIQGASVGKIAGVPHTWLLRVGCWVAFVAAAFRSGRFGVHRLAAAFSISTTSADCSSSIGESDTPTCHSERSPRSEESLFSCFFTGCPTRRCCVSVVFLSAVALQLLRTPRRSLAPHNILTTPPLTN